MGAGDQGMMIGFACNETPELMPLPIALAHRLIRRLAAAAQGWHAALPAPRRQEPGHGRVSPTASRCASTRSLVSTQHDADVSQEQIREDVIEQVIKPSMCPPSCSTRTTKYFVNPTGRFVIGGPMGDSGLTGRKIIVDTYGGMARHGGGAFSGKDPTKVDRSAAYAARYVAKNVVAAGLADRFEIQIAYAIGVAHPLSIMRRDLRHRQGRRRGIVKADRTSTSTCGRARSSATSSLRRPIYKPDRRLRPLRPHRHRPALGADQQGRGAAPGGRAVGSGESGV